MFRRNVRTPPFRRFVRPTATTETPPKRRRPWSVSIVLLSYQHVADGGRVHRLHEMHVESRLARAAPIDILAPPRERHEHRATAPTLGANTPRYFATVELRHADIEHDDLGFSQSGE